MDLACLISHMVGKGLVLLAVNRKEETMALVPEVADHRTRIRGPVQEK